jgi:hypothetical protein
MGGPAVAIHCERADDPHREFSDLDAITTRRHVKALTAVLTDRGYEPDRRFNALNADTRLIFDGPAGKLDVFIGAFEMCHRISLDDRLDVDRPTISATDLLLTKLQVIELNEKDLTDLTLLLETHGVQEGEGDHFNAEYLRQVLGSDWGLWKTINASLARVRENVPDLGERVAELETTTSDPPRSLGFRLRGLVGERARWYDEPEEVDEDA